MRLSTHLAPEVLAKLAAIGSPEKSATKIEPPAPHNGGIRKLADQEIVLPRIASDDLSLYMPLKQARKELGLSYAEVKEQALVASVPMYKHRDQTFVKKADVATMGRLLRSTRSRLRLDSIATAYEMNSQKIDHICGQIRIHVANKGKQGPTISAMDYDLLRRQLAHLAKQQSPQVRMRSASRGLHSSLSTYSLKPATFVSVVSGGLPTLGREHK